MKEDKRKIEHLFFMPVRLQGLTP